jgi:hypothetical protein
VDLKIGTVTVPRSRSGWASALVSLAWMPYADPVDQPGTDTRSTLRELLDKALTACRPETISAMVDAARIRSLRGGECIRPQGEPIPLSLIVEGYGIVQRTTADGQQLISGIDPPGVLFGYAGIGVPSVISSVEIVALTDCVGRPMARERDSRARQD